MLMRSRQMSSLSLGSDRSSLSSGSPTNSPLQHQVQPTQLSPPFSLASAYNPNPSYNPSQGHLAAQSHHSMKLHQPSAIRSRNAIPIVNPSTGMRVASPPPSVSPGRMQVQAQAFVRRW